MFIQRIRCYTSFTLLAVIYFSSWCAHNATAATIFESGTLGLTGVTWDDFLDETVRGANVSEAVFDGVRFELTQSVVTTQIGGHFVGSPGTAGTFFGAIVKLDDENDFPDSGDLSTPDVLGNAKLTFPVPSDEVFGDLSLSLDPGWYALVFGSGLFDTSGDGAAPLNNPDIGVPSYIAYVSARWKNSAPTDGIEFKNYRFVVRGTIVPEPSMFRILAIAGVFVLFRRASFRH